MTEPAIARRAYDGDEPTGVVGFTAMADGTRADYELLDRYERRYVGQLPNRLIETLDTLTGSLGGYKITRLQHSLQTATRARLAGADVSWVVAALMHDIGDELAPYNHSELAASVLQPYVPEEVHWVVLHHGVFQSYYYAHHLGGDRNLRDRYMDHRWAPLCLQFCAEWDQNSFDPDFPIHEGPVGQQIQQFRGVKFIEKGRRLADRIPIHNPKSSAVVKPVSTGEMVG